MAKETQNESWSGRTDNVLAPQLGGEFWKEGKKVSGVLHGWRDTSFTDRTTNTKRSGIAYRLTLQPPLRVNGELCSMVEIPSLTGFTAALQDIQDKGYKEEVGDIWEITCVGIKKAKQKDFNDSPEFTLDVIRKPKSF